MRRSAGAQFGQSPELTVHGFEHARSGHASEGAVAKPLSLCHLNSILLVVV